MRIHNAAPYSTYHPDADPDSDFVFDADPDTTFRPDADRFFTLMRIRIQIQILASENFVNLIYTFKIKVY